MIVLPAKPGISAARPFLVDTGIDQRGGLGANIERIDRPGSHYGCEFSLPPMDADTVAVFVSRLARAKSQGLSGKWPLLRRQGNPGLPLVDTSGGASLGTNLRLKGLVAGYPVKEGYWLTVIDAAGATYLHNVSTLAVADSAGKVDVEVWPPLRAVLANNDVVNLARPWISGRLTSAAEWTIPESRLTALTFTIEEEK